MPEAKIVVSAVDQTKAAFDSARRNMQGLGDQAMALPARFGTLGLAIAAAFTTASLSGMIKVLDDLDAMSERTGIAVTRLSELRAAAELSDTSLEALSLGMRKLSTNMSSAMGGDKAALGKFDSLGITPEQLATFKTADDLFVALADKFSTYEDGATKNAKATEIFGKRGEELIGMLNRGGQSLQAVSEEARQLGAVFSGDLAKAASDFNDNLARMKLAAEGVKAAMLEDILPSLVRVTSELVEGRKQFGGYFSALIEIGIKTSPFDTWSDGAKKASSEVQNLTSEISRLQSKQRGLESNAGGAAFVGPSGTGISASRLRAAEAELVKATQRQKYFDSLISKSTEAEAKRLEGAGFPKVQAPAITKLDGTTEAAEVKKYTSALQSLEQQLGALNKQSEVEKITYQTTRGSLIDLTAEHKRSLIAKAAEIDQRKTNIEVLESEQTHFTALFEVMAKGADIQRDSALSVRAQIEQYQFETSLIGKTIEQAILLNAERKIELDTRQQLKAAAENAGDNNQQYEKDAKTIEATAQVLRESLLPAIKERIALERDAATGATAAFDEYINHATNAAEQTKRVFGDAFKGMEDALVSFVKTGKLDFKSLADSIITDLIRIEIQRTVTAPLAETLKSAGGLSGVFGGVKSFLGFAQGGTPPVNEPYWVGEEGPELRIDSSPGAIIPNHAIKSMMGNGGGTTTVNQPIIINAQNASAETVGQIRALMPAFLAENKRIIEGVIQQSVNRRGGRF